jgi:DNA helicase II / ATP-dependent DNA helicase PcrA
VPVELALLEAGVPYHLEGNNQVFDCPEILALVGYLHLVTGTLEGEDLPTRVATLLAMLSQPHVGVKREELEALARAPCRTAAFGAGTAAPLGRLGAAALFAQTLHRHRRDLAPAGDHADHSGAAAGILKTIVDKLKLYDFYDTFSARMATAENRVKTCQAFIDFAAGQQLSIPELLDKIAGFRAAGQSRAPGTLLITSVHRAKGLEWPLVILPGLEEGSFPFLSPAG